MKAASTQRRHATDRSSDVHPTQAERAICIPANRTGNVRPLVSDRQYASAADRTYGTYLPWIERTIRIWRQPDIQSETPSYRRGKHGNVTSQSRAARSGVIVQVRWRTALYSSKTYTIRRRCWQDFTISAHEPSNHSPNVAELFCDLGIQ